MAQITERIEREAVLVEDAALIRTMGMPVLEAVPSHAAPYERTDPFILVHEGRFSPSQMAGKDTKHPHRGFDNKWYVLKGAARTRSHHGSKRSDRVPVQHLPGPLDVLVSAGEVHPEEDAAEPRVAATLGELLSPDRIRVPRASAGPEPEQ